MNASQDSRVRKTVWPPYPYVLNYLMGIGEMPS